MALVAGMGNGPIRVIFYDFSLEFSLFRRFLIRDLESPDFAYGICVEWEIILGLGFFADILDHDIDRLSHVCFLEVDIP